MNLRVRILLSLLVLSLLIASWQWFRPYEWRPDPEARATVAFSRIERDEGYYWLDVHTRITDPRGHDLKKPVRLLLPDGREIEPADTTLEGSAEVPVEAVTFRFWLEADQATGPLHLKMNDGSLLVRKRSAPLHLEPREIRFQQHSNW